LSTFSITSSIYSNAQNGRLGILRVLSPLVAHAEPSPSLTPTGWKIRHCEAKHRSILLKITAPDEKNGLNRLLAAMNEKRGGAM
jgi:hypothetical protein